MMYIFTWVYELIVYLFQRSICSKFLPIFKLSPLSFLYLALRVLLCIMFLDAAVREIVFLISFSNFSLLVYQNITNFYIFILCPETSLTVFSCSENVSISPRFSTYKSILLSSTIYFFLSTQVCPTFHSDCCQMFID